MQYTTNYNLGLVEGTDLVNPLTQMNPNFSDLDTIIKGVSDKTVTTATEITVGTVHGLTRANTSANVFQWTATANFTTGDTFTVDGVTVTALKTDGTVLQTGEYIIGAAVLAILDGTRLTIFVAPKVSQSASDVTYDNTQSGLSATDIQDAVDEVAASVNTLDGTVTAMNTISTINVTSSFGTVNNNSYRLGNIAFINFILTLTSDIGSGFYHYADLDVNPANTSFVFVHSGGSTLETGFNISTTGVFTRYAGATTGTEFVVMGCFAIS